MTRTLYGESYPESEGGNRRGRACLVFDGAALAVSDNLGRWCELRAGPLLRLDSQVGRYVLRLRRLHATRSLRSKQMASLGNQLPSALFT